MKLPASLKHALAFVEQLPDDLPFPELCAGAKNTCEEGDWCVDYYMGNAAQIAVSIDASGAASYTWIQGNESGHGTITNGDISPLIAKIREVVK